MTHDSTSSAQPTPALTEARDAGEHTLYTLLRERTSAAPDRVLFHEPVDHRLATVSAREFLDEVDRTAAVLAELGVVDGDCIATWLPNWASTYAWQFAASAVGAHVIGVNTRYNVTEVQHILTKARPRVLAVAHDFQGLDLIGRARTALQQLEPEAAPVVVPVAGPGATLPEDVVDQDLGAGVVPIPQAPEGPAPVDPVGPRQDRLATAFTTSGSTGLPKLAAHRESAVLWHAAAVADHVGFRDTDVLVGVLPYSGVFGFNPSMGALHAGASILLHPVFDPARLVRDMSVARASHYCGADDILTRIRDAWTADPVDLSSWRWIGIADFEGKSRDIAAWAAERFGTTTVGVYGSSELFALTAFWSPQTPEAHRLGGGGHVVSPQIEVRVADPLDDRELGRGDEGELQFRGPNVVDAYLGDSGEGEAAFTPDGWFRSGDLGQFGEDGGFVYVCRMGDVLRLKGFLVDPSEIEQRIAEHPAVHTAKVVGVPDADGATQATGFVTLRDEEEPVSEHDLIEWCREALARFKVPRSIRIIEEMPTTAGTNGTKIKAATLREWARERVETGASSSS